VCSGVGNPGHVALKITATVTAIHGGTAQLHFNLSSAAAPPTGTGTG
jgi:hypothetical protein